MLAQRNQGSERYGVCSHWANAQQKLITTQGSQLLTLTISVTIHDFSLKILVKVHEIRIPLVQPLREMVAKCEDKDVRRGHFSGHPNTHFSPWKVLLDFL